MDREIKILIHEIKRGNVAAFYNSSPWRSKRREILERDKNECQRCKSEGRYSKANTVHHKEHLKDRPDLCLIDTNLASLCESCHNLEHPEKIDKMNGAEEKKNKNIITKERW